MMTVFVDDGVVASGAIRDKCFRLCWCWFEL